MMMESPSPQPEAKPISGWRALLSVLTEPAETFRRLGDRPAILPPYLVLTLIGLAAFVMMSGQIQEAFDLQASMMAEQGMPLEAMATFRTVLTIAAAVAVLAEPWVTGLVIALVALFVGQFQGGGVSFRRYYGMIGYARLPLGIMAILGGIFQLATGQTLNLSAGALLPAGSSPQLIAVLSTLNPFTLWYYVLLAIGFAALFGRPARKGWALPALLWAVNVLVSVAFGGLAAQFM